MLRTIKKIFMWLSLSIISLLVAIILIVMIFVNTSPQFGQRPEGEDLERIKQSKNYGDKGFINLIETTTGDIVEALKKTPDMFFGNDKNPNQPLPVAFDETTKAAADSITHITWYGHSAFLLELEGKRILIDPMLGDVAAPIPFGSKRFSYEKAIPIEELTNIDMVIISHDHYDHLDYPTIQKIKSEVNLFITPLGVGSHLKSWGVDANNIIELDWWDSTRVNDVHLVAVPSRHFSGRGITDRDATQWAGWILKADTISIYFSGDGGYGPHFKEIGEKHGPFDFAMLECGQYNEAWGDIHMMPEESVQAGIDVNAALSMPIHWGAFRLAPHGWTDPIVRFTDEAQNKKLPYILPKIGERFQLGKDFPKTEWWKAAL